MTRWRDILLRTRQELVEDNVPLVAAGVAFYVFLGTIPAVAAIVSLYGFVMDPKQVQHHFQYLTSILPAGTQQLEQQILDVASNRIVAGWGAVVGLLVTLWSGSKATKALIKATNLAYDCPKDRGFVKLTLLSLGLTLAGVVFAALAIALVAVLPAVLHSLGLGDTTEALLAWLRWPLLMLGFLVTLAVLYRYGPNRPGGRWRWFSLGSVVATVLWVSGSLLLSFYVSQFANINKTYGSLGAIILVLLWLYLTAYAVIAGAELNSVTERLAGEPSARTEREEPNSGRKRELQGVESS
jgi:membrane protein